MANGIAAFLKGAVEGYDSGIDQARKNKKAKREEEQFALQKQQAELQMQNTQMEIDRNRREAEYQADLKRSLAEVEQEARGRVTGEAVDEMSGDSIGQITVAPGQAPGAGLRFREGTVMEQKPLSPVDYQFRIADTLKAVAARHGKIDLNLLEQSRKFGQKVKAEGAVEAMKYFMATQDTEGARKMFNEKGGVKLGDDVQLGVKEGLFGPVMFGFKVDKDGKQTEVFDGFRDIILPSMSPEAYATAMVGFAKIEATEKGDTFRTGVTAQATRDAAGIKAAASGQLTIKDKLEMVSKRVSDNLKAVFSNAGANLDADRRRAIESEIGSLAEEMIMKDSRVGVEQAANAATTAVYKKYGIVTTK